MGAAGRLNAVEQRRRFQHSPKHMADALNLLPLNQIALFLQSELLIAGLFFIVTAVLIALCVPGVLLPMALSSGALLGGWQAAAVVAMGALAGSQILFLVSRRFAADRLRHRLGPRFERFQQKVAAHGLWYVVGLRIVGAPHFLVTAGSALLPMRATSFAIATLIGLLPAIGVGAFTGSAI